MSINGEESNAPKEKTKTKIVVHINNYILADEEETSNDLAATLRSLATPDSFFIDPEKFFKHEDFKKIKNNSQSKTDLVIVHAKSLKFPVKFQKNQIFSKIMLKVYLFRLKFAQHMKYILHLIYQKDKKIHG
jgi:hypothetical protein